MLMVSSRVTNHYEVLGIDPAAGIAEIKRAFAAKMSLFGAHLLAEAPLISAAFEALRDPAKRAAYDASLGLNAKPQQQGWGFAVAPPRWTPFMASAAVVKDAAPPPSTEPHVTQAPVDPRAAAIAASLREVAKPATPVVAPKPASTGEAELEAVFDHIRAYGREEKARLSETRAQVNWKGPAIAVGGVVLGAGLIGSLAGLSIKDNAARAEPAVSVTLPPAKKSELAAAVPFPEPARLAEATIALKANRTVSPQRPAARADQIAENLAADALPAVEQTAADAQPAHVVAASMPLPDRVVARTIERIGYACGDVASTTAGEQAGTFTVTCTSGQTYQASPVRGRYHFRRLGSR
jgi:hypothetical protein